MSIRVSVVYPDREQLQQIIALSNIVQIVAVATAEGSSSYSLAQEHGIAVSESISSLYVTDADILLWSSPHAWQGMVPSVPYIPIDTFLTLTHAMRDGLHTDAEILLHAIIEATQDAISVTDQQGRGILINPAYTRLTGLTASDVLGKPATVDIAEGDSMHLRVLSTGKPVRGVAMKVGPMRRDVVVNVAPLLVNHSLRGSVAVIHDVSEMRSLSEELDRARERIRKLEAKYTFADIVGRSTSMTSAISAAQRAAQTRATVLLRGESGCGKELFAHAIHNASDRRHAAFVRVNCAAISENLMESELFGYDPGAFSGALRSGKRGYFEEADGGTIFLDEIAELTPGTQAKLLRALQEREIVRVGSSTVHTVDVRMIAATHVHLERAIAEGRFREDLYYRLNVVPILIPPLRYRQEDLDPLVEVFIRKYNADFGRSVTTITSDAMALLASYDWPGNVRELENVVGRAMLKLQYGDDCIDASAIDMPTTITVSREIDTPQTVSAVTHPEDMTLATAVREAETDAIQRALQATGQNKTAAARLLGISVRALYYSMQRLGIVS